MSIKLRLAFLLGSLLVAFTVSILVLRRFEWIQAEQVLADTRQGRIDLLERWMTLSGESLRQYANDYSQWDDLVAFVRQPERKWAQENIDANLANFNLYAVWVLRTDGTVVDAASRPNTEPLPKPPLPIPEFLALAADTPFMHFFAPTAAGLLEVRGAPIQPSADYARSTPPCGWLLAARLWDQAQLKTLGDLTEGAVKLTKPGEPRASTPAGDEGNIHVIRPLNDWRGRPVGLLEIDYRAPEIAQMFEANAFEIRVFAAFGSLVICALALSMQWWVLRPLNWISDSLGRSDTSPIRPLLKEGTRTELGRVAMLIESAFAQRTQLLNEVEERNRAEEALRKSEAALRETLDERSRLGRDLHDGVIQSLYAAGMVLAAARARLRDNPAEAEAKMDQACSMLNETIRDVRNFIEGLEPEMLREQTFTQALERLISLMRALRPLRATISIDQALAEGLNLEQRAHSLQIAREAVSNAVRHGQANSVRLDLRRRDGRAEFTIEDDGSGFDPATLSGQGRGLNQLAERARELGAELTVASKPGKGTRVVLTMPLPDSR